jgi:hypothetical protein
MPLGLLGAALVPAASGGAATAIGALALGGTAGNIFSQIYGANKTSGAAEYAADVQAKAAKEAAEIQAKSAERALQYSRAQSQLSLDQYNAQQRRLQPYRNLGLFAMGQPFENAPDPLALPPVPPDPAAAPPNQAQPRYRPLSQIAGE